MPGLVRLPEPACAGRRAEGGLRLNGQVKDGGPGEVLVTYLTVVRNAEGTLARTLASVKAQRGVRVEHVVVDGLSEDRTLAVIEGHANQIDYYVSEPDTGLYGALNKALALARGNLVCVLNADDWLTADAAATAARALQRVEQDLLNPQPRLLLSAAWAMEGERRRLWLPGALNAGGWLRCPDICHNAVYATPAAYRVAGPYDERLRIVADSQWLLTAQESGVALHTLNHPTVHYALGGLSGDSRRHVIECAQMLRMRFPALTEPEAWGLMHAFYPHDAHLQPFFDGDRAQPEHLGRFVQALIQRHASDAALMRSLDALQWQWQASSATRVRSPRLPLSAKLRRSCLKRWLGWRTNWVR